MGDTAVQSVTAENGIDGGTGEPLEGVIDKDTVGACDGDLGSPCLFEGGGGRDDGSTGGDHIVDDKDGFSFDVHSGGFDTDLGSGKTGLLEMVVGETHAVSDDLRTACGTYVGRKDHVDSPGLEVLGDDGGGLDVLVGVGEVVEGALLVEVDGDDPVAVHVEVLAHDLGGLGLSGFEDTVLPGVSEVGDDEGDRFGTELFDGILEKEHLDELVVREGILNDYNVVIEFLYIDTSVTFAVRERSGGCLDDLATERGCKLFGKVHRCGAAYYYHDLL